MVQFFRTGAIVLAVMLLAACGPSDVVPDADIAAAVQDTIQSEQEVTIVRSETIPLREGGGNIFQVNFAGYLTLKSNLYTLMDSRYVYSQRRVAYPEPYSARRNSEEEIDDEEVRLRLEHEKLNMAPHFIKKVESAGTVTQIADTCRAEKVLGKWKVTCSNLQAAAFFRSTKGYSRERVVQKTFSLDKRPDAPVLEFSSPEEDAFFAQLPEHMKKWQQKLANFEKTRQEKKQNIRRSYMTYVSNPNDKECTTDDVLAGKAKGQMYDGALSFVEHGVERDNDLNATWTGSVRVRIVFSLVRKGIVEACLVVIDPPWRGVTVPLHSFWPEVNSASEKTQEEYPLLMRAHNTFISYRAKKSGEYLALMQYERTSVHGMGFKFVGDTVIGELRTDTQEYKLSATFIKRRY